MTSTEGLDVVIVSYRSRELLRSCLLSLRDHPPRRPIETFVVDNASSDGTLEMLRDEFPEVGVTASETNLGFSAANNIAISAGRAPYVLVLNPDTQVTEGALEMLLGLMDERRGIGMCGCRLELENGALDHAARRAFPTILGALGHFSGAGRLRRAPARLAQYRAPLVERGPVDAVNGAFMLMRRAALADVGLFDEGFWMYMEDLDLCYRFAKAGWIVWYEPGVTVRHVKGGTTGGKRDARLAYAFHYGMYRFYRKHYAPGRSRLLSLAVYLGIGGKAGLAMVRSVLKGASSARHRGQR